MISILNEAPALIRLLTILGVCVAVFGLVGMVRGALVGAETAIMGVFVTMMSFAASGVISMRERAAQAAAKSEQMQDEVRAEAAKVLGKETPPQPTVAPTDTGGASDPGSVGVDWPSAADVLPWVLGVLGVLALAGAGAGTVFLIRSALARRRAAEEAAAVAAAEEEARLDRVWAEAEARHDILREELLRHQSDIDLVLSMPLINDHAEPKTAAFIASLGKAADLAHDTRPSSASAVDAYAQATRSAELAWGVAWRHADRVRLSGFAPEERATIKKVASLMKMAQRGSTAEERRSYYQRAMAMLDNLIDIPKPAAEAIETRVAGVLANPHAQEADLEPALEPTRGDVLEAPARRLLDFGRTAWRRIAA